MILRRDLFTTQEDIVHYYESEEKLNKNQVEEEEGARSDLFFARLSNPYNIS